MMVWIAALLSAQAQTRPLGIDVSSYQGSADSPPTNIVWTKVKSSGIAFAWAKATEGTGYIDADFVYNESNAKSAGVLIGAYHFAHPDTHPGTSGADSEATYFWNEAKNYIKSGGYYLMPMLDAEVANPGTQSAVSTWVNRWCQDIVNLGASNGIVLRPVVYTYTSWATSYLNSTVTNWPLWMASPNGQNPQTGGPSSVSPWSKWTVWQYGGGTISGVEGTCDEDVFNGTQASLVSTLVIGIITNEPVGQTVWQGSNATFTVGAANITHYQWTFNGSIIPGATTSAYTITNAQVSNAGAYAVNVTNSSGVPDASSPVFLEVVPPLTNSPGAIVAPAGMADWWPADGNPNDIFGNVNGTPAGGFYYSAGKSGEAFHFDGSSAYISTGAGDIAPPWTACMWLNFSHTPQSSAGLLEDGTYSIKLEQYGSASHNVGISQLSYADSTFNYAAPINQWVHLAFVATSSSVTLYANGVSQGSITTNNFPLPRAYIGAGYITSSEKFVDYMLGSLDDLMIFKTSLSQAQIQSIYNAGSAGLVRAPQITGTLVDTNGQFIMGLQGFTGKNYTIHASPDLTNWTSVGSIANASGTNSYTVPNPTNNTQMFYKVSQTY